MDILKLDFSPTSGAKYKKMCKDGRESMIPWTTKLAVYTRMAQYIEDEKKKARPGNRFGLCHALSCAIREKRDQFELDRVRFQDDYYDNRNPFYRYPEIDCYKPADPGAYWFSRNWIGMERRARILKRAIQVCKDNILDQP